MTATTAHANGSTAAAPEPPATAARPAASPRRRALITTGLLMLFGLMPGMGIPGGLMLGLADRVIIAQTGSTALRAIGTTAWPLALIVTVLLPLPLLLVLPAVSRWRTTGVALRLVAVLGTLLVWGVVVSFVGLTLALNRS